MAISGTHNLAIEGGADFARTFVLKNNGVIYDLTDWVFAAQIRNSPGDDLIAEFDTEISEDGERLTLSLGYDVTSALEAGHFEWDLFALRPDGIRMRLLEGVATVVQRITNAVP